jgi:hypothetical protein
MSALRLGQEQQRILTGGGAGRLALRLPFYPLRF